MIIHSFETKIIPEYLDCAGNFRPSSVLSLFEKAAREHSEILGVGVERMRAQNLLWVVTQIRYEVSGIPHPEDNISVTTWPLVPGRLGFQREYKITASDGSVIIKGSSLWVLIDSGTRKISLTNNIYKTDDVFSEEKNFSERFVRIEDVTDISNEHTIIAEKEYIDGNGHVNNTKYADFVTENIDMNCRIKLFRIEYLREILPEAEITLLTHTDIEAVTAKGICGGIHAFSCKIVFSPQDK